jgi:hypothetical protein
MYTRDIIHIYRESEKESGGADRCMHVECDMDLWEKRIEGEEEERELTSQGSASVCTREAL